jgi:hypothetical protein
LNKAIPERPDQYGIHGFWYTVLCLAVDAYILTEYYGRRLLGLPEKE